MQIPMEWVQIKELHQMNIPHFQLVFHDLLGSLNPVNMSLADLITMHVFTENATLHFLNCLTEV